MIYLNTNTMPQEDETSKRGTTCGMFGVNGGGMTDSNTIVALCVLPTKDEEDAWNRSYWDGGIDPLKDLSEEDL
jgi:hypothetical protein